MLYKIKDSFVIDQRDKDKYFFMQISKKIHTQKMFIFEHDTYVIQNQAVVNIINGSFWVEG